MIYSCQSRKYTYKKMFECQSGVITLLLGIRYNDVSFPFIIERNIWVANWSWKNMEYKRKLNLNTSSDIINYNGPTFMSNFMISSPYCFNTNNSCIHVQVLYSSLMYTTVSFIITLVNDNLLELPTHKRAHIKKITPGLLFK